MALVFRQSLYFLSCPASNTYLPDPKSNKSNSKSRTERAITLKMFLSLQMLEESTAWLHHRHTDQTRIIMKEEDSEKTCKEWMMSVNLEGKGNRSLLPVTQTKEENIKERRRHRCHHWLMALLWGRTTFEREKRPIKVLAVVAQRGEERHVLKNHWLSSWEGMRKSQWWTAILLSRS